MRNLDNVMLLTPREMQFVKGGASAVALAVTSAIAAGVTGTALAATALTAADVAADDKRPPRPGGGISTL
jgi:hypothetical protein